MMHAIQEVGQRKDTNIRRILGIFVLCLCVVSLFIDFPGDSEDPFKKEVYRKLGDGPEDAAISDPESNILQVPSTLTFSPRETITPSTDADNYGRVLLYVTSHMSRQHEMFLKYCWPNVLARSKLLQQADVAVFLNPAEEEKREEAIDVVKATFENNPLTVYLRENQAYATGAVMAMHEAMASNFFDGYDWVIRLNPDVLIRDDAFLTEKMADPEVSALLINCSNRGSKVHTDFFVIKPIVLNANSFPEALWRKNAELSFTKSIQESVLERKAHRWIPGTAPRTSQCRAGHGHEFHESPIVHQHYLHPEICSIPESDKEAVEFEFTDPWPNSWTLVEQIESSGS
mmetsp:Transcript_1367/g.2972  ORF Transcript_1367/g.2972 Transcript_1367/m.2972 type:complete len:344 (-) Transcript_1367:163-1194(-)